MDISRKKAVMFFLALVNIYLFIFDLEGPMIRQISKVVGPEQWIMHLTLFVVTLSTALSRPIARPLLLYRQRRHFDSPSGSVRVIFFPINAPGMGRFQLLDLGALGYGLELMFWVVIAIIVYLTLTITLITTLTII